MFYKVLSLNYLHLFPPPATVSLFLFGDNFENRYFFSLRLHVCVVVFIHEKENWQTSVFPAFCHATFHHALITCCNVARAGYIA